jgi:hypothetical protein
VACLRRSAGAGAGDPNRRRTVGHDLHRNQSDGKETYREQLRDIFFARQTKWPDGTPVRVFVLPDQHPLHIRFAKETLGVYPYQLRSTWDRMVYSGTGVPPTVMENVKDLRRRIEETPGAIGYMEE